jgi:hypothetical protein
MRRFLLPLLLLAFALPSAASAKPRRKPKSKSKSKPKPVKVEPEAEPEETEPEGKPEPGKPAGKSATPNGKPAATPIGKPGAAAPAGESGKPTATPPAPEINAPPPPGDSKPESAIDVDSLRKEYLALRDQLFRSRARAAALGSSLYSTRIRIHLDYKSARFYTITRAVIRLDGGNVYEDTQGAIGIDSAPRFDGFLAPGRHQVTVRIEATGKDDQRFTTALESAFVVQAPAGKDVIVKCTALDDGDIAYQWKKSEEGSYKLRLDVAIGTQKREAGGGKRAGR